MSAILEYADSILELVNETGDLIFTLTDLMKVGGWLFNLNIAILAFNIGR